MIDERCLRQGTSPFRRDARKCLESIAIAMCSMLLTGLWGHCAHTAAAVVPACMRGPAQVVQEGPRVAPCHSCAGGCGEGAGRLVWCVAWWHPHCFRGSCDTQDVVEVQLMREVQLRSSSIFDAAGEVDALNQQVRGLVHCAQGSSLVGKVGVRWAPAGVSGNKAAALSSCKAAQGHVGISTGWVWCTQLGVCRSCGPRRKVSDDSWGCELAGAWGPGMRRDRHKQRRHCWSCETAGGECGTSLLETLLVHEVYG